MDSPVLERTLKKEDLPTLGSPTMPTFRLLPGLPSTARFSGTGGFFGGILAIGDEPKFLVLFLCARVLVVVGVDLSIADVHEARKRPIVPHLPKEVIGVT